MLDRIKSFANTEDKKRLLSNFMSLSILQGANYLLPLITFPYLVRVLGVVYFGLLAFASATIAYFNIITDYGFNIAATRKISIQRTHKEKVSEIFSSVITIKLVLMLLSFLLLSLLVFSFDKFSKHWEIYFFTFGSVLGQMLFPVWFFQGMERMKYITYLNIFSRLVFTIAIFIFVSKQSDYFMVPILNSLGMLLAGYWSFKIVKRNFGISFSWQKKETLLYYLKDANQVFTTNVAISFYTTSTTFILGFFTSDTIVGYYAGAEKIIQAFKGLMTPVFQTIYPYISKQFSISKENWSIFLKKMVLYTGVITGFLSLLIFTFSKPLVDIILGNQYHNSIIIMQLLSFTVFMIGLSTTYVVLGFYAAAQQKIVMRFTVVISIFHIMIALIMIPLFQEIGASITVLFTETMITLVCFIQFNSPMRFRG